MLLLSVRSGLFVLATIALLGSASRADDTPSGIRGVVRNATCFGPCSIPPKPYPLFESDDLTVIIKRLPERELVAKLRPKDGTFGIEVPPGLYRVRAFVGDPKSPTNCWEGSARRVTVVEDWFTRVRLKVINICVD